MLIGGGVLFVFGVVLMFWAMVTFVRARTAILPFRPASTIVTTGPFQFTRNPMYLGLTFSYLGLALVSAILWAIAVLPVVLLALHTLVIRREEAYLSTAFSDEYAAYRNRVRRWI
jgi:protein-S-isoprenylcysteine O-methyltransferase Ste14